MAIIDFATAADAVEAIQQTTQMVSGMSVREAVAALNATQIGSQAGAQIIQFPMAAGGGTAVTTLADTLASDAWQEYIQSEAAPAAQAVTAFGAAAAAAKTWANGALFGTGQGTLAATGGLLTLSVPTAIALATPLLGVAVGEALYNSNKDLFDDIAEEIAPYIFEGTETVSAVFDALGQVFIPKGLVDKIKDLFQEKHIGVPTGKTSDLQTNLAQPIVCYTEIEYTYRGDRLRVVYDQPVVLNSQDAYTSAFIGVRACGPRGSKVHYQWYRNGQPGSSGERTLNDYTLTHNGVTSASIAFDTSIFNVAEIFSNYKVYSQRPNNNAIWTVAYGSDTGGYPEGLTEWAGTKPAVLPEVPIIIVVPEDPGQSIVEVPYTPIQLPSPDQKPYISPNPEEQPNPQAPTPLPYIDPFIDPWIPWQWPTELPQPKKESEDDPDPEKAPYPDPFPWPDQRADPERRPYEKPDPTPKPEPTPDPRPWTPDPPTEIGESPDPRFPPTDPVVPFPSVQPSSNVSGLIHIYNPTPSQLQAFGRWLWVTLEDATQEKIWNNPFDGVISAHELYATPSTGASEYIRSGFLTSDVSSATVPDRYIEINCGSIVIPEVWNNYLDYSPYTRTYVYLPFIGIVEVDTDDIVGHAVNILYHVDTYTGACIAQITVARSGYSNTIYQFSGNCAVDVPLAGGSQAAIKAAQINANAWGLGSVITGLAQSLTSPSAAGQFGGIASAVTGAMQAQASVVSAKSSVQHSGAFGASFGAMGIKTPYIIIRRPIQKQVNNYNEFYGFPAHKRIQIGSCSGYLRVREVHVISATANDDEKRMIEQLLKTGVIV